jgi:hypothetical protein
MDDFINEVTTNGKFWRADWNKSTPAVYTPGNWYDWSISPGNPVAVPSYSGGTNLTASSYSDTNGFGIYSGGNVSSNTKHVLNASAYNASTLGVPGVLMLVDHLLWYPVTTVTTTTSQVFNNTVTLPRYADGVGVRAYISAGATMGAGAPNLGISYTNQSGVAARSLPFTVSAPATTSGGTIIHTGNSANRYGPFLPLAAGDRGIRSIQSITIQTSMTAGFLTVVLCKPLVALPLTTVGVAGERDLLNQLPSLPRVQDGANLQWLYFAGSATPSTMSRPLIAVMIGSRPFAAETMRSS